MVEVANKASRLFNIFETGDYFSIKHNSYFQVYETLFSQYVGKPITFVEIGVLNGGSLFMWRDYFGEQATIIGIDLNPAAKKWEKEGFKIFIGDQADPLFWDDFFKKMGKVDVVLDDGGHTNNQQIVTLDQALPHINDGGMVVVEDVHTSYFHEFGNPSRYSFISYAKRMIDGVNARFPRLKSLQNKHASRVFSISFYESIVCFHVDSKKCYDSSPVQNNGISDNNADFRYHGTLQRGLFKAQREFAKVPVLSILTSPLIGFVINLMFKWENSKAKQYFK